MSDAELMANEVVSLLQKSTRVDGEVRFYFDVREGISVAVFQKSTDCYYDYSITVPTSAMDIAPEDAAWTGAVDAIYDKAIRCWEELAAWEKSNG